MFDRDACFLLASTLKIRFVKPSVIFFLIADRRPTTRGSISLRKKLSHRQWAARAVMIHRDFRLAVENSSRLYVRP